MAVFRKDGGGPDALRRHVRRLRARYPVFYDGDGRNTEALGIRAFPRAFLLDRRGVVVWEGSLLKNLLPKIEARVRRLLADERRPGRAARIAYLARNRSTGETRLFSMKQDGSDHRELAPGAHDLRVEARTESPDGMRVVFTSERDGNHEVYVLELDRHRSRRLTDHAGFDGLPTWSPDGALIAFVSSRSGSRQVHIMSADGSAQRRLTHDSDLEVGPIWFFAPDVPR